MINRKVWNKMLMLAAIGVAAVSGLAGCGKKQDVTVSLAEESHPMMIKMHGSLDESYLPFFDALSEQFPGIELKYEFQWDKPGEIELERRILHDDGPDLAVVIGSALHSLTEKNLLLDLTNAPFSTRYHVSTMTALNDQGRVLGLPLPNDLRALICNREVLKANGVTELPKTVPELIEVCKTLTAHGQGALIADEQIYQMLLRTAYLCKPAGYDWLQAYNRGEGTMAGTPAENAWKDMEALAAVSGCSKEDASSQAARRTELMMQGKYAFRCATMSNMRFMMEAHPDMDLVALPMLGATEEDQWAFYAEQHGMRYFVANRNLAQPENDEKRELVLQILDWISTDEAQQILAYCGSAAVSYVNGVELELGETMEYLKPVIEAGHLTSSDKLERGVWEVMTAGAVEIVDGTMTAEEAVMACDIQNKEYIPAEKQTDLDEVIGKASAPVYWRKPAAVTVGSPMTQLAAEAMAEAFPEADFAFAMAKNAASTLYAGEITMEDALVCANGEGDRELVLAEATGAQIRALIEAGVGAPTKANCMVPYGVIGKGRLLHPAGLTYQADITRENGDKITELVLADGSELDMGKTYTIVVSGLLVDGVTEPNLKECQNTVTGKYLKDVLVDYIRAHEEVSPPELGFEITGAMPVYTLP